MLLLVGASCPARSFSFSQKHMNKNTARQAAGGLHVLHAISETEPAQL